MNYSIRTMQDRDILQAIDIDREAFPTQWPHPTYASFKQELRNRLARYIVASNHNEIQPKVDRHNYSYKSFRQRLSQLRYTLDYGSFFGEEKTSPSEEYIVGIAGFWAMVDEAHIITIATRKACRRRGIGEWLLISVINMAMQLNTKVVTLEVRVSNREAQELYQKYGFQKVGIRPRYYSDNGEDALIMSTDTMTSAPFQTCFQQLNQIHRDKWRELYC